MDLKQDYTFTICDKNSVGRICNIEGEQNGILCGFAFDEFGMYHMVFRKEIKDGSEVS